MQESFSLLDEIMKTKWISHRRTLHVHAAVYLDNLSCDVPSHVRSKEEADVGDIFYLSSATEWYLLHPVLAYFLWELCCHGRLDETWSYSIGAYTLRSEFLCDRLGETDHASL